MWFVKFSARLQQQQWQSVAGGRVRECCDHERDGSDHRRRLREKTHRGIHRAVRDQGERPERLPCPAGMFNYNAADSQLALATHLPHVILSTCTYEQPLR